MYLEWTGTALYRHYDKGLVPLRLQEIRLDGDHIKGSSQTATAGRGERDTKEKHWRRYALQIYSGFSKPNFR